MDLQNEPSWGDIAHDGLFRDHLKEGQKIIDDRGMASVSRHLIPAMGREGFTHARAEFAKTGTVYVHGSHPAIPHTVSLRFSTHPHGITSGDYDRPFGKVVKSIENPTGLLKYDINTVGDPKQFRKHLDEAQAHIKGLIKTPKPNQG